MKLKFKVIKTILEVFGVNKESAFLSVLINANKNADSMFNTENF